MESEELKALANIKREAGIPYFSTLYDIDMWRKDFATLENAIIELEVKREIIADILTREEEEKYEVLEIIKKRFTIQFCKSDLDNYYGIMQIGINPIYIKTQEEYELLKRVLRRTENGK